MSAIEPLTIGQVAPELRTLLQPIVDRLGYFGAFFGYAGHAPGPLAGFMQYSGALKAALPDDLNEAIALTVCTRLDFAYERIQHERLAVKLGLARDWIAALVGRSSPADLAGSQAAARALALAVLDDRLADAKLALDALADAEGPAVAVAALFQVTRFREICAIGRLFAIKPPVASIFADDQLQ